MREEINRNEIISRREQQHFKFASTNLFIFFWKIINFEKYINMYLIKLDLYIGNIYIFFLFNMELNL